MDLTDKELAEATAKAAETHKHAKRFEKVECAAGTFILCNATRQQVRAVDMQLDVNVKLGNINAGRAGLFQAMCVLPGADAAKAACEDFAELEKDEELQAAMARLNGARSK